MESLTICKLCCKEEAKYVCPRCNIPYCSLPCYQSQAHIQCSESFYKDCVTEQLKSDQLDTQSKKKMLEILQRVKTMDELLEEEDVPDSDDEDSEEGLAARLQGVDLDDADDVWAQLTQQERQEFEELLRSGDVSQVIPQWQLWWYYREQHKLVEDVASSSMAEELPEWAATCPAFKKDIQPLSQLSKAVPSASVRWNLVNVLAAYSVVAQFYNGDHQSLPQEAAAMLVRLSDNLRSGQVFDSLELAVMAVHMAAVNGDCIAIEINESQLREDIHRLMEGLSASRHNHYVLAALSDTHSLFVAAKRKLKETTCLKASGEFSKRFPNSSSSSSVIPSSELNKYLKKVEYYLSWVVEYF